jgi:hydroxymethylbilane synthase
VSPPSSGSAEPEATVLRLATRGSALARAQAALAAEELRRHAGIATTLVIVQTTGDKRAEVPLDQLPGQGWFTAELERCLMKGRADVAVHSAKDLPTAAGSAGTELTLLRRGDPRDAAVTRDGSRLAELRAGATVGTSSARRVAQLGAAHPQLSAQPMRGNVDTRLRKLESGDVDALLIAAAGLDRLGLGSRLVERFDPREFVPAPAQGAIALQTVTGSPAAELCAAAADMATTLEVAAERSVLAALGGGCLLPLGAYAKLDGDRLLLTAFLATDAGVRRAELAGPAADPVGLGQRMAAALHG